ncbi:sigma-70 family RNA polymerase sigma factor [soil metagenome]
MRQIKIKKSITNRESLSLEKYLNEIGKVELISPEEEVSLAVKIKKHDQHAIERLVKANLRFVVSVAKQYENNGLPLSDLINEGNMGLIKAAMRFDESKGFKFISYAVWWIRQSIMHALAEQSRMVRLPLNKLGLTNRILKAYQLLEQEYEREPTPEEIADLLNIDVEEVIAALNVSSRHLSMDSPINADEEYTFADVLENKNAEQTDHYTHYESLKTEVGRSLETLSQRQKEVVCYFFGIGQEDPLSLEDIGQKFNLTRERVRQIKEKAILRLQTHKRSGLLKVYLG